jgi:hypothetical protein
MNFFQLLRSVLDELYDEIPANSQEEGDEYIRDKLSYLHEQYALFKKLLMRMDAEREKNRRSGVKN